MRTVIVPEVSRHVHFVPGDEDRGLMIQRGSQPLHAVVIFVVNERSVNLSVIDHDGFHHTRISVTLAQPGDDVPAGSHCRWMPHQVNQAGRADAPAAVGDKEVSPILADLLASTATSLSTEDLAGVKLGADMTPQSSPAEGGAQ